MSEDEVVVLLISLAASAIVWGKWLGLCLMLQDFGRKTKLHVAGALVPLVGLAAIFLVLQFYASHDVRDDNVYIFFYLVLGAAWLAFITYLTGLCGLSLRDDWLERGNPSAAALGTGVLLGGSFAFAGGNIGDGPGWWVVVFCALLSTGTLLLCWWLYNKTSNVMERILVDRDLGAGARLGGFLSAIGLMTGRSVAGDWEGAGPALVDFLHHAWPLLPYTVAAGILEVRLGRNPASRRSRTLALFWPLVHLCLAWLFLEWAGPWK